MNNNRSIPKEILQRITNLPRSGEGLIISCLFEKDSAKLNNKKKTTLNRLNFYIRYQVGGPDYRRNLGYYSVKSRYYDHSNTTETKGEFTFNNPEKYSIISDFSEYNDIANYAIARKKYDDTHKDFLRIVINYYIRLLQLFYNIDVDVELNDIIKTKILARIMKKKKFNR
jgi:hypothetical protein